MTRSQALIVDDSSTARIMLARMLGRIGIQSEGVASAEEAFEYLENHTVDLIFLDHLLPGMNGFEALRELKRSPQTRDTPVFMYTSQHADRYLEEARTLGAAGVIGKQTSRQQLAAALDAILSRQDEGEEAALTSTEPPGEPADMADISQHRRLTGRLATLEIAYEEANEEMSHLRREVARMRADDLARFEARFRRLRFMGLLILALLLFTAGLLWYQLDTLRDLLQTVNNQSSVMRDIIAQLLDLVGRG